MNGIVEAEALVLACARLAPRLGIPPRASETALRVALREADHLADDIYDMPAALLFALGRTPRCFSAFRTMSVLTVEWHAHALGFKLEATRAELCDMLTKVARRELEWDEVRAYVGNRLLPYGG